MRNTLWALVASLLFAAGCYVHGQGYVRGQATYQTPPPPPPEGQRPPEAMYQPPPPPPQPPPPVEPYAPSAARVRAPAAPDTPAPPPPAPMMDLVVSVSPASVRRGNESMVYLRPFPRGAVTLYFNGIPVPKKMSPGADGYIITVPGDASSGFVEVDWNGHRYRSNYVNVMP